MKYRSQKASFTTKLLLFNRNFSFFITQNFGEKNFFPQNPIFYDQNNFFLCLVMTWLWLVTISLSKFLEVSEFNFSSFVLFRFTIICSCRSFLFTLSKHNTIFPQKNKSKKCFFSGGGGGNGGRAQRPPEKKNTNSLVIKIYVFVIFGFRQAK